MSEFGKINIEKQNRALKSIGVNIERTTSSVYIDEDDKIEVFFVFMTEPRKELSFTLLGEIEQREFIALDRNGLINFLDRKNPKYKAKLMI